LRLGHKMKPLNKTLNDWLRLLRAPNLFTVPGDPVAGFLLAGGISGRVFPAAGASLFLYAGGLLMNDLCDMEEDRRDRPGRPLPGGAVGKGAALAVAFAFGAAGLGLCALAGAFRAGLCAGLCIITYNAGIKKIPFIGAVNMGLCRGFSVLIGGAAASGAVFHNGAMPAALVIALYIATVTILARNETKGSRIGPPAIGMLIRLLLPIQAAFCAATPGGTGFALALLALWPISRAVGKRFAGS